MEDVFGDFEEDFKNTEKAAQGAAPGRVPEETYKFVLTSVDLKGDGVLVDHDIFITPAGTKAVKLFCEILDPETVENPKTKEPQVTRGSVLEHVFWVTKATLPYVKRDLSTILERDIDSLREIPSITWAGRTFEGVVRDDSYNGYIRSKINFINPWVPEAEEQAAPEPEKPARPAAAQPNPKKPATAPAKSTAPAGRAPVKGAVQPTRAGTKPAAKQGVEEDIPF